MKSKVLAVVVALFVLVGCATVPVSAPEIAEKTIGNQTERLQVIGALSEGVEVSLDRKDIPAADQLNDKIQQIAETPTSEQVSQVVASLDNADAAKELEGKITQLIEQRRQIEQETRQAVESLTQELAKVRSDKKAAEEELAELKNPFHAITYGIKTLVKRFLWTITGLGVVFLLLRTFAASNPIVGAVFDVFQRLVAYVIKAVSAFFPRAVEFGSRAFQRKDETLSVLVDAIEALPKEATLADLRKSLAEDMDKEHKSEIAEIQKRLGW